MYRTTVSIESFLTGAIDASVEKNFLGMIFLLARKADGKKLQDEIYEDWSSLNDLTGEQLLFVVAGGEGNHGVSERWRSVAYEAPGLSIESNTSRNKEWSERFLSSLPGTRYMGDIVLPPEDRESFRAAITNATSSAARFFRISEKYLPCIVILPTNHNDGVVISVAHCQSTFSIYSFLRCLLIEFEPIVRSIERSNEILFELNNKKRLLEKALLKEYRVLENFDKNWKNQKDSVLKWLNIAIDKVEFVNDSKMISSYLKGEIHSLQTIEEHINSLLQTIKEKEGETLLFNRLNNKLQRALKQLKLKEVSGNKPENENTIKLNHELSIVEKNISYEKSHISKLRMKNSIGEAAKKAAIETGFKYNKYEDTFELNSNKRSWNMQYYEFQQEISSKNELYDLAISYASEDVTIAREIAINLKAKGFTVFYAGFETSRLWGKNLYDFLTDIFANKSRFTLVLLSKHYNEKMWTRLERQAAQASSFMQNSESLLPLKLDDSESKGIISTIGYLDFRSIGIDGVINAIVEKINK